jgi:cephalosporin-C deacetylase-like acetyl esterase
MKKSIIATAVFLLFLGEASAQNRQNQSQQSKKSEMKQISIDQYTTFKVTSNIAVYLVTFKNQYNMDVSGHLFIPKNFSQTEKHPAIIVGHPMGAVKEQSADVYASKMAEKGFITLAIDLSFWGESEGQCRSGFPWNTTFYCPQQDRYSGNLRKRKFCNQRC